MERTVELLPVLDFVYVPVWLLSSLTLHLHVRTGFSLIDIVLYIPGLPQYHFPFQRTHQDSLPQSYIPVANSVLIQLPREGMNREAKAMSQLTAH